jgi:hypothetical protein
MNLSERASIVETSDMVDGSPSDTATLDSLAAAGVGSRSTAGCCWNARKILLILSSCSRRYLALSLRDCACQRLISAASSSCRRVFWTFFGI